jgi:hypothetical protein
MGSTIGFIRLQGEIKLDLLAFSTGRKHAGQCVETNRSIGADESFLKQDVSGGERCMAAKGDFHLGREPAEPEAIGLLRQKRRLRKVHLGSHSLEPGVVSWA